ncbi:MAG: hypothetical protein LQ342_006603 [Letrouitia transgressa]|nr:MAG: hypothetical protein LQ342_006603 [Letrouitia transgressa]
MAAVPIPSSGLSTPSSSATRRRTAPTAPKLRDSCQACASSKLKCFKEKPTCSRCAKRGIICEYVATKRGGHKHGSGSSKSDGFNTSPGATVTKTIAATQPSPPLSSWFTPNSKPSDTDPLSSPDFVRSPSTTTTSSTSANFFPNLLSPVDQSLFFAQPNSITDLDSSFASPEPYCMPDLSDTNVLDQPHFFPTGIDSGSNGSANLFDSFSMFEDTLSDPLAFSTPSSKLNSRVLTSSEASSNHDSFSVDSNCFCLARALGLMNQLFPSPSAPCTASATQGLNKNKTIPTIQAVIAKNEHTIDSLNTMLQCPCSQDGYLLTIISLTVFKVMGWYAAAARTTPCYDNDDDHSVQSSCSSRLRYSSHSEQVVQDPAMVGSYCLEGKDKARMGMQLVLSELYRVQRLLNPLSTKLKAEAAKSGGGAETPNSISSRNSDHETTLPVSAVILYQLEMELRKRLKTLSLEIVEGLKWA